MAAGIEKTLAVMSWLTFGEQARLVVDDGLLRFRDVRHEPYSQFAYQIDLSEWREDGHPFAKRLCRANFKVLEIAYGPIASQARNRERGLATKP